MVSNRILCWIAASLLTLSPVGARAPKEEAIPEDSLELARGPIQSARTGEAHASILGLVGHARDNSALRTAGAGYDLKVSFQVDSGGETSYDGSWKMEDIFDPQQGLRWTATAAGGYTITEISSKGDRYAEGTPGPIPLRLQEARAALFDALPSSESLERSAIRTSDGTYLGEPVTCALLSGPGKAADEPGRRWLESEECVDAQSGLLMVHSQAPGRYYAYDYANAPQFAGQMFPRKVIVTEGGKIVSQISVDSLEPLSNANPNLFVPTEAMKARGRAVKMGGAQKLERMVGPQGGPAFHTVCVFGLVTDAGKLVDAHSLQPSDPYSGAAVAAAQRIDFARRPEPGEVRPPPLQHFVFVMERFAASR